LATKRQKVEVGIFLATAVAILTLVLLVVSGLRRKHLDRYHLEFEENIAGLSEGSKVTYRGVPVGKILDLVVTPQNRVGITIGIDPAKVTLREGVRGRYSLVSIFGPYVIDLTGGGARGAPLLAPGSTIPVQTSLLAGLEETFAETVPFALQRATKLIERIDSVLATVKPEDAPAVLRRADEVLANANRAIDEVRAEAGRIAASVDATVLATRSEVQKLGARAAASLEQIQEAGERGTRLIDTLQATLEESRQPLADSLKRLDEALAKANKELEGLELAATSAQLREASKKVGDAADSLGTSARTVAQSREDLRRTLENIERALVASSRELDRALRSAHDLFDALERDPSAVFRGRRD